MRQNTATKAFSRSSMHGYHDNGKELHRVFFGTSYFNDIQMNIEHTTFGTLSVNRSVPLSGPFYQQGFRFEIEFSIVFSNISNSRGQNCETKPIMCWLNDVPFPAIIPVIYLSFDIVNFVGAATCILYSFVLSEICFPFKQLLGE